MDYEKTDFFFSLKDNTMYPSCNIYQDNRKCKSGYTVETERSVVTRWSEHNNPTHYSEPA